MMKFIIVVEGHLINFFVKVTKVINFAN